MTLHPLISDKKICFINLALAASSSLIEIGPIVALIQEHASLLMVLFAGLSYQFGNALARTVPFSLIASTCFAGTGTIMLIFTPVGSVMWFTGLVALSWGLQTARRYLSIIACSAQPSTAQKRMTRVGGFVVAAMLSFVISAIITMSLCLVVALSQHRYRISPVKTKDISMTAKVHPIHAMMVLHQMHYFSYCYAVLVVFAANNLEGNWLIGVWFALGWVSYLSIHWVLWSFRLEWVFIIGHVYVAVTLIGLSFFSKIWYLAVAMWILTGFGGGTVFCLSELNKNFGLSKEQLVKYEDIGHIGGVALAVTLVMLAKLTANDLPIVSASLALLASFGMVTWTIRRRIGVSSTTSQLAP